MSLKFKLIFLFFFCKLAKGKEKKHKEGTQNGTQIGRTCV